MTGHPQDDLPGLLSGELPPAAAVAVDRHLAGCDPCRRDLAAVAVAASALRDVARLPVPGASDLPPLALPAGPAGRGGRGRPPGSPPRDRGRRSRWLLGAAAALVALLLGVGGYSVGRDRDPAGGRTVALAAPAGGPAPRAEAHMRGHGDDQIMTMTAQGLPRPEGGAYYEVWLVGAAGDGFPVGVLAPNGEGVWSLPAEVAGRYRTVHVTLEPADGDPAMSQRTVLRGGYA